MVRPKKYLGQHFLTDRNIAHRIVDALPFHPDRAVVEIGPGTGVLTGFLIGKKHDLWLIEIDSESVVHLHQHFPVLAGRILEMDFLKIDPHRWTQPLSIIGNFPYNISSQIFFKILESRQHVLSVVCMIQKEVADRLAAPPGSKTYGILSVLLQAWYDIEYLFKVPPGVFHPPPAVMSAVIRLTRNNRQSLPCNEQSFVRVVKQAFNTRRKTLRNCLKSLPFLPGTLEQPLFDQRAEQLGVDEFVWITEQLAAEA
jgi:16S rRNA (adenine1518-N6/adenine1519-N6)-dimethyltransferase